MAVCESFVLIIESVPLFHAHLVRHITVIMFRKTSKHHSSSRVGERYGGRNGVSFGKVRASSSSNVQGNVQESV